MPRPRKTPPADSGADLLAAVNADAPADSGPAEPPKPAAKTKAPPAKAKTAKAKAADPEAVAPPEAGVAPKPRAAKRPAAAKTAAVAEAPAPAASPAVPAAKPAKSPKPKRKAGAAEPMLDLGMAEAAPRSTAAAQAPSAAAPAVEPAAAPAAPVAEAKAPGALAPKPEASAQAAAAAEPRYPRRQPVDEPPPRRPAPAPLARPAPRAAPPPPPRPLSMAELAERQRQSRELARHPERDSPAGREAPPRPAPLSMQERAMRYRGPAEPENRAAPAAPPQTAAPTAPAAPAPAAERRSPDDGQARALEAARHKREAGPAGPTCAAPPWETAAVSGGATIALVTRNHAAILEERLMAWRAVLPEPDLRWAVLDLGSTDATAQKVEEFPGVRLIVRPGGLVEPAATLRAALKGLTGDAVVLVDVEAQPDSVVESLLRALKAGAAVAVAPRRHPDYAALSRAAWDQGGQPELASLLPWGEVHGGLVRFGPLVGQPRARSLVQRLCPDPEPRRWDLRRLLPTRVRNLLNRFGVLGGAA